MRAYKDGFTRQSIRLRLDAAYDPLSVSGGGQKALLKGTLPLAKSFVAKLWGGDFLKTMKISLVDNDVSTLLYREAVDPRMDSATVFLPSRPLVTSDKITNFLAGMGDRLVVFLNSENAGESWKVENRGRDFYYMAEGDAAIKIANEFSEQTYYYFQTVLNNWQTIFYRSYPNPWEIFIEDLQYNRVKLGESATKPSFDQIVAWMEAYEEENKVAPIQKVGKYLKDQRGPLTAEGATA